MENAQKIIKRKKYNILSLDKDLFIIENTNFLSSLFKQLKDANLSKETLANFQEPIKKLIYYSEKLISLDLQSLSMNAKKKTFKLKKNKLIYEHTALSKELYDKIKNIANNNDK